MEKGFYHPSRGYWQTNENPSQEVVDSYPQGTIEVPLRPGPFYDWNGSQWVENIPAPPTNAELDAQAEEVANEVMEQNLGVVRVIGEVLAEVIFRVSNSQVPQNITEQQARTWVRNAIRDKYRDLL